MLTPVRAASSSSFPSQGSASALSADGIVRAATAVVPVNQVESPDLTAAATAKLNILLLAVRARMVDALLDVLNATGEALSQPRDDAEPDLVFAARLADTIQKLPAGKIEAIERQLAAQGHSIPLRLLAETLKNPAGPEATRIAAYLETVGYKDRDLATRAVVRSYRQNDGSPARMEQRPEISLHRDTVTVAARTVPAEAAAVEAEPPVEAAGPDVEIAGQPGVSGDAQVEISESTGQRQASVAASATPPAVETPEAEELPASEAEVPAALAEAVDSTTATDTRATADKGDPVIPKSWAGIAASLSKDETDMIVVIIRDQQAEVLLEAVDIEPAVEIDVLLDDTLIADIPENLTRLADQTLLSNGLARQATPTAMPSPMEAAAARAAVAQQAVTGDDTPSASRQMIDATYAPVLVKIVEGVPYAIQPYDFAKDEADDGGSREMNREDHNGDLPQDQDDDEGQQGEAEPADAGAWSLEAAAEDAGAPEIVQPATTSSLVDETGEPILMLPTPVLPMTPVIDEAYARYKRMVGWE